MTVYFSCLFYVNFKNTTLFVGALNLLILRSFDVQRQPLLQIVCQWECEMLTYKDMFPYRHFNETNRANVALFILSNG